MVSVPMTLGNVYSDYVCDLGKRRSLTDDVFTLANSWKATLGLTVVLSTTEVEYGSGRGNERSNLVDRFGSQSEFTAR